MNNYHVILVHFPIALFTLYSIIEILRFRALREPNWFHVKTVVVIAGSIMSVFTILAGVAIKQQFTTDPQGAQLVNTHAGFALTTSIWFGIIALSYLVAWLSRNGVFKKPGMLRFAAKIQSALTSNFMILMALIGLGLITFTWALGGSIAFGPASNPVSDFVYHLFFRI